MQVHAKASKTKTMTKTKTKRKTKTTTTTMTMTRTRVVPGGAAAVHWVLGMGRRREGRKGLTWRLWKPGAGGYWAGACPLPCRPGW